MSIASQPSVGYRLSYPPPWVTRCAVIAVLVGGWELGAQAGWIDSLAAPAPSEIVPEVGAVISSDGFDDHLRRTLFSIFASFGAGLVLGVATGILSWKVRPVGTALEPYVVTMYAMPTLVFYPILLAIMGLGAGPIVVITTVFAVVPITISTVIALRSVNPTLVKLAASLNLSRAQTWRKVLLPATTPLAVPGLKLGFIYSVVGTIAMEFILANQGIGFQIGFNYRQFEIVTMYAYITVVVVLSVLVNMALTALEHRVRRDML